MTEDNWVEVMEDINWVDHKDPIQREIVIKKRVIENLQERMTVIEKEFGRLCKEWDRLNDDIVGARSVIHKLEEE